MKIAGRPKPEESKVAGEGGFDFGDAFENAGGKRVEACILAGADGCGECRNPRNPK